MEESIINFMGKDWSIYLRTIVINQMNHTLTGIITNLKASMVSAEPTADTGDFQSFALPASIILRQAQDDIQQSISGNPCSINSPATPCTNSSPSELLQCFGDG